MIDSSTSVRPSDPRAVAAGVMSGTFQPHQHNTLEDELLGQHIFADLIAAMGASAMVAPFVRYGNIPSNINKSGQILAVMQRVEIVSNMLEPIDRLPFHKLTFFAIVSFLSCLPYPV
jgi:hypothetical protein